MTVATKAVWLILLMTMMSMNEEEESFDGKTKEILIGTENDSVE